MKKILVLSILHMTVLFSFTVIAQKISLISNGFEISFPKKIQKLVLDPLPAGTYSVGAGGYFPTIDSVFNKLSIDGIAGEVIIELTDNLYIAPTDTFGFFLNGPIPGAGPNSRVTFKPAANKNVTIEGSCFAVVHFLNTNYVTVDGIGLMGATTLTIHSLQNLQFPWNVGLEFMDNSDHNIVQNTIFISEDYTRGGIGGPAFYPDFFAGSLFAPDSNLILNNFVKKSAIAIYVSAEFSAVKAIGNIIRGNIVGSETDSLIGWGIQAQFTQNTIIENNVVQNLRRQGTALDIIPGINSYLGNGDIIRNNIVHNIHADGYRGATGILLSGSGSNLGNNNLVYNNMIYDIQSSSTQYDSKASGILIWSQNNPKIYYNSVYLDGTGNGANPQGSAALYIRNSCTNVEARNNILVNTRDESPYFASSIYDYITSNLTSDYNDLFYEPNQYNSLVRIGSTKYNTLTEWQVTGQDSNSVTEMPNFALPDLHIDWNISTLLDGHATPISGITTDIDNEPRNAATPDIGADEFVIVPVELTSFTATTNGKEVILNWSTATELNNQGFEIERSEDNISFNKIGFVNGFGTTTEPKSYSYSDKSVNTGTFYYRLKQVDYDGSYEYSDVVEVEWRAFNSYLLEQNYPNPFNPTTTIGFGIQNKSNVKITILNAIGEAVSVVLNEEREPGFHQVEFNAANLPSGVYFYRLKAGEFISTKKMILLK